MNSTITYEQPTFRRPADVYPKQPGTEAGKQAGATSFGARIISMLGRIAERSGQARRAESYRRLNALSDSQLAAVGIRREELLVRCFGARALM